MTSLDKKTYNKQWREANKDKCREYNRNFFAKNKEKVNAQHREWYQLNKVKVAERKKIWRAKNLEHIRIQGAEYRMKQKLLVISTYSNRKNCCACCGETEIKFLTVDHLNGNGNKHRKSLRAGGGDFNRWLINNKFPQGYQILCFNCNCSKGFYGKCPHKT